MPGKSQHPITFMDLPLEGTRISLAGDIGTVRFVGPVDKTVGIWLGVEWDDPKRGLHDGVKDGKRYFSCRYSKAGSFIRPSAKISYGTSFLEALTSKYVEALHGHDSPETVVLGSSHGTIIVEAVSLDKIRGKLANLAKLCEVSLDTESVSRSDIPGAIRDTSPNIRGLDLSTSLIPSWDVVALIARELPALQRLALKLRATLRPLSLSQTVIYDSRNCLQPAGDLSTMANAFLCLTELQLNDTNMTWPEMQAATAVMPNLRLVEMGYNFLTHLHVQEDVSPENNSIQIINLDSNTISDWIHIWKSLNQYKSLQWLILTSNCIEIIPLPENPQQGLHSLKHISLSYNKINNWDDIDALSFWCPGLETLSLFGNPLTDRVPPRHARSFIISRIPSLLALDGATISPKERADSEIFYQSYIIQYGPESEEERRQAHPQWPMLCKKHGLPEHYVKGNSTDKLIHHLIAINLHQSFIPTGGDRQQSLESSVPFVLKVLPSMTLRALKMKIRKVFKCSEATIFLWLQQPNGGLVELGRDHDRQNLHQAGITETSNVIFHVVKR